MNEEKNALSVGGTESKKQVGCTVKLPRVFTLPEFDVDFNELAKTIIRYDRLFGGVMMDFDGNAAEVQIDDGRTVYKYISLVGRPSDMILDYYRGKGYEMDRYMTKAIRRMEKIIEREKNE